jgi:hypothetical protein
MLKSKSWKFEITDFDKMSELKSKDYWSHLKVFNQKNKKQKKKTVQRQRRT